MMKIYNIFLNEDENLFVIYKNIISQNLEYLIEIPNNNRGMQTMTRTITDEIDKKTKDIKIIKKFFNYFTDLIRGFYDIYSQYGKKILISIAIQNESIIILSTLNIEVAEAVEIYNIMNNINKLTLQELREKFRKETLGKLGGSMSIYQYYLCLAIDIKSSFILDKENSGKIPLEFIVMIE